MFNGGPGPLLRVSSAGGEPVALTKEPGSFPSFLPDGRHVMFFQTEGRIDVAPVDGGESKPPESTRSRLRRRSTLGAATCCW